MPWQGEELSSGRCLLKSYDESHSKRINKESKWATVSGVTFLVTVVIFKYREDVQDKEEVLSGGERKTRFKI